MSKTHLPPCLPARRTVLRSGLASLAVLVAPAGLSSCASSDTKRRPPGGGSPTDTGTLPPPQQLRSLIDQIGPLGAADAEGVRLPEGFSVRIVARSGEHVLPDGYIWHLWPDGGATFATDDGGWIYVSNSELPLVGGVGALRFDADGEIIDAYPILEGTNINCAGGPTPWGTWLSCEELSGGRVFETDPWGEAEPIERPALGRFKHEAATIDPVLGCVYLSEDEPDGCFYRFVSEAVDEDGHMSLTEGVLEVAVVDSDGGVTWVPLPDPLDEGDVPPREQVPEATVFTGGEGIWWFEGTVFLSTKGDDKIWAYDTVNQTITTIYDRATTPDPEALYGVDNLTVSACGDVLVAEDQGQMRIVAVMPSGELVPLVQIEGQEESEITGPAFDPSGTRLYFSSQRARGFLGGITYEITGPFHELVPAGDVC